MPSSNNYKRYGLIGCDGSNLTIATNPNDVETAYKSNQFGAITNHLHLNAFYDVLNRIYLDAVLQTASEYQECRACINMMKRSSLVDRKKYFTSKDWTKRPSQSQATGICKFSI